ncbi:hypothetical protein BGZ98_004384, partial [Dissophora globulifera]
MNTQIFEGYTEKLYRCCTQEGDAKVVCCLDNIKYHHRESNGSNGLETRKTILQLNEPELIK